MNFMNFLKYLAAAAIGGAINTTSVYLGSGTPLKPSTLGWTALSGAITGAAALWVRKPGDPNPSYPIPQDPPAIPPAKDK